MWHRIDKEKPHEDQKVFYWYGLPDKVYSGFYESCESEWIKNVFYGQGGFLTDAITYWMPRAEGQVDLPEAPTTKQKEQCIYHPKKETKK